MNECSPQLANEAACKEKDLTVLRLPTAEVR